MIGKRLRMRVRWEVYYVDDGAEWVCGVYSRESWAKDFAMHCNVRGELGKHTLLVRRVEVWL